MKIQHIATLLATGAAAAAIASAAPATAAPQAIDAVPAGITVTERNGHTSIDATPDQVSPPRSYGPFASPLPLLWD